MDMGMDKGRGMDFEGTEELCTLSGGGVVAGLPFLPLPFGVLCSSLLCSSPPSPLSSPSLPAPRLVLLLCSRGGQRTLTGWTPAWGLNGLTAVPNQRIMAWKETGGASTVSE